MLFKDILENTQAFFYDLVVCCMQVFWNASLHILIKMFCMGDLILQIIFICLVKKTFLSFNHSGAGAGACSESSRGGACPAAGKAKGQAKVFWGSFSAGHGALPVNRIPTDRGEKRWAMPLFSAQTWSKSKCARFSNRNYFPKSSAVSLWIIQNVKNCV